MAIAPTSDFILDVAQAADPERLKAAQTRLATGQAAAASGSEAFSEVVQSLEAGTPASQSPLTMLTTTTAPIRTSTQPSLAQKFEAQVLKTFIEFMMPQNAESVFGSGYAGSVSKSFLAEMIAKQVAARGGIGIAKQVDHAMALRAASQLKQST